MTDVIALNIGGATHVGALAVVHPGVETPGGQLTLHRVEAMEGEYMTLTDGNVYCSRTGGPKGYYGPPTLRHRVAVTEGSPMFESWISMAHDPESRFALPNRTGSTAAARRPSRIRQLIGAR